MEERMKEKRETEGVRERQRETLRDGEGERNQLSKINGNLRGD